VSAEVVESAVIFSVLVTAVVPEIVTGVGANAQVGADSAPLGALTVQVRFTAPVKPPPGVTVMVPEPVVAGRVMEMGEPATESVGVLVEATVTVIGAVPTTLPVPVAVTVAV